MITLNDMEQPILGQECKKIRREKGLTMEEMAKKAGVTRQTIHNFENRGVGSLSVFMAYYNLL